LRGKRPWRSLLLICCSQRAESQVEKRSAFLFLLWVGSGACAPPVAISFRSK
jgi:hypothetical protein